MTGPEALTTPPAEPEPRDLLAIAHTLSAYCHHVDSSELDALVALFTEDAVLDVGHGIVVAGRERLRAALFERIGRWTTTNHHSANVLVTRCSSGEAEVTSYVYAFHDHPGRGESMHLWGRYTDRLVKFDDRWLIGHRVLRVAGVVEGASPPLPERFERFPRAPLPSG